MNASLLADVAHRLTRRDRSILDLVWEHRVLTTHQLTTVFFPSSSRCQQRLRVLHRLFALVRFQPWAPAGGSEPTHWVLGPAGAHVLAVERGLTVRELGYRQDSALDIAVSPRLGHQIGVNDFFVRLHAYSRHRADGSALLKWLPERKCASVLGDHVRPDAFGHWSEAQGSGTPAASPRQVEFFLEHDTGSETLARVAQKIGGYVSLAQATGTMTPLLFWLPSAAREANLRKVLGLPRIPVATAVQAPATSVEGPAGAVWLPVGITGPRQRLAALSDAWEYRAGSSGALLGGD
ncbi:replication-relaxation family protein [Actinomadura sp. 21ATH]|uniref:replication-relaxation family protein n=1 Tax=Actinomadura sp. 21ATH TaxID=1735444 RepID=UPI0035BF6C02